MIFKIHADASGSPSSPVPKVSLRNPLLGASTKQNLLLSSSRLSGAALYSGSSLISNNSSALLGHQSGQKSGGTGQSLLMRPSTTSLRTSYQADTSLSQESYSSNHGILSAGHLSTGPSGNQTASSYLYRSTTASSKKVKGHKDAASSERASSTSALEISLPEYDFHLEARDFESLDWDDEVAGFPLIHSQDVGIEVSLMDIDTKKVITDQL